MVFIHPVCMTCPVPSGFSEEGRGRKGCSEKSVEGTKEFAGFDAVVPRHMVAEAGVGEESQLSLQGSRMHYGGDGVSARGDP